jgi:hypothetical protein
VRNGVWICARHCMGALSFCCLIQRTYHNYKQCESNVAIQYDASLRIIDCTVDLDANRSCRSFGRYTKLAFRAVYYMQMDGRIVCFMTGIIQLRSPELLTRRQHEILLQAAVSQSAEDSSARACVCDGRSAA